MKNTEGEVIYDREEILRHVWIDRYIIMYVMDKGKESYIHGKFNKQ